MAHEYGWAKRDILEDVYLDELVEIVSCINKRKIQETKLQMSIVQNPHVKDPKALWAILEEQEIELNGYKPRPAEFDPVGFEILKSKLSANPNFIVK